MDFTAFSEMGIGLATVFILWMVVKYFISALEKQRMENSAETRRFTAALNKCTKVIGNHIAHQTTSNEKMSESLDKLTQAIQLLLDKK